MKDKIFCTCFFCVIWLVSPVVKSQTITGIERGNQGLAYQPAIHHPEESLFTVTTPVAVDHFDDQVLDYINEMRRDPKAFYRKYVENYIKEKSGRFTGAYTGSLKRTMLHAAALPAFQTDPVLKKTATLQLDYLARFGGRKLTHQQGKTSFADRMKRSGLHCLAENLYTADNPKALEVVLDLLIDQNVPSLGHRKNLMNPLYTHIGIVHGTPPGGRTLVVMDFGCKR